MESIADLGTSCRKLSDMCEAIKTPKSGKGAMGESSEDETPCVLFDAEGESSDGDESSFSCCEIIGGSRLPLCLHSTGDSDLAEVVIPEFRLYYNPHLSFVWPSAKLLSEFLVGNASQLVRNKRVIELGCGLGLPSITAALLGAEEVVATDLNMGYLQTLDKLVRLEKNRAEWSSCTSLKGKVESVLHTARLDWFEASRVLAEKGGGRQHSVYNHYPHGFDTCLCADVNYEAQTVGALMDTVLLSGCDTVVLISREQRAGFNAFAEKLKAHFARCLLDREPIFCTKREIGVSNEERHSVFLFAGRGQQ